MSDPVWRMKMQKKIDIEEREPNKTEPKRSKPN